MEFILHGVVNYVDNKGFVQKKSTV